MTKIVIISEFLLKTAVFNMTLHAQSICYQCLFFYFHRLNFGHGGKSVYFW